ncbi:uncharacterized protein LOC144180190 [Haemaphysalis longicornis]
MPSYCAMYGCTNTGGRNAVVFHSFPKDPRLAAQWTAACKRKGFTPTKNSQICSDHFPDSAYERSLSLMRENNIPVKGTRLRPGAVPTTYAAERASPLPRAAFEKRRKREILENLLQSDGSTSQQADRDEEVDTDVHVLPLLPEAPADPSSPAADQQPEHGAQPRRFKVATRNQFSQVHFKATTSSQHKGSQVNLTPTRSSRGVLARPPSVSIGIQVSVIGVDFGSQCDFGCQCGDVEAESEEDDFCSDDDDADYYPGNEEILEDGETSEACDEEKDGQEETQSRIFLVEEACLKRLLAVCHDCLSPCHTKIVCEGTQVYAQGKCAAGHNVFWTNQEVVRQQPILNLKICAAILFAGCNPHVSLRMLASIGIPVVTPRTFFTIQHDHLWPAIDKLWTANQQHLLEKAQGSPVKLAGDGRADSPGFSAKYGTYSLLDVEKNKILHFEVVQSNEAGGSCRMELEGLKRSLMFLEDHGVAVELIVTDRHAQIKCFLRKEKQSIRHEFDVWHWAKGVSKKLHAAAKQPGCRELEPWIKSVSNHLYWSAASSKGCHEMIVPKWQSLLNHIRGVHTHDSSLFPSCVHGSKAYNKLKDVVTARVLLADMPQLSTSFQTYGLETYHSLMIHFVPKSRHYSYDGMKARTQLAALHYNENSARKQATTKDGTPCWEVKFPRARGGDPIAYPVMEPPTYGYVEKLLNLLLSEARKPKNKDEVETPKQVHLPLSSSFPGVDKKLLVEKKVTRYSMVV